jgi:hypothetical protein
MGVVDGREDQRPKRQKQSNARSKSGTALPTLLTERQREGVWLGREWHEACGGRAALRGTCRERSTGGVDERAPRRDERIRTASQYRVESCECNCEGEGCKLDAVGGRDHEQGSVGASLGWRCLSQRVGVRSNHRSLRRNALSSNSAGTGHRERTGGAGTGCPERWGGCLRGRAPAFPPTGRPGQGHGRGGAGEGPEAGGRRRRGRDASEFFKQACSKLHLPRPKRPECAPEWWPVRGRGCRRRAWPYMPPRARRAPGAARADAELQRSASV